MLVASGFTALSSPLEATLDPALTLTSEMKVGDCFGKWDDTTAQRKVSCTKPHWYEVYGFHTLKDGPYPGDKAVEKQAENGCDEVYDKVFKSGRQPEGYWWVYPLEWEWEDGERRVVCMAMAGDRPLTKPFLPR